MTIDNKTHCFDDLNQDAQFTLTDNLGSVIDISSFLFTDHDNA